ncbi:bacterial regulatory helix-turn-helix, lysR family protein [Escherichia coli TW11039]|nr:bacterial regulatory helix-turn-helix, lysR family protein [Escherichia coli TW11039]
MKIDLNLLPIFIAVAEESNFSKAAARLGVTRSAVSQGIRRLEDAFGTMLVMRTTRSVNLTEAGERLHKSLSLPLSGIEAAFEEMVSDHVPRGLLRIAVTSIAEEFLSGPLIEPPRVSWRVFYL